MGVQLQVYHLDFLWLDTHVIYTSITHALMAFFTMFCTVFNNFEKQIFFAQKNFPRDIFNSKICYRYN